MIEYSQAKAPTLPKSIDDQVRQLQSDIEQLKQADGNQYREQLKAPEHGPLVLSGHYVELVIEGVVLTDNYIQWSDEGRLALYIMFHTGFPYLYYIFRYIIYFTS